MVYASRLLLAEWTFAQAVKSETPAQKIIGLRKSAALFPLDHRFRLASALAIGSYAAASPSDDWKLAAIPELRLALARDPTAADVLAMLIKFEMDLGLTNQAQQDFNQFKRVAVKSPLIEFVESLHKEAGPSRP
jgi:hypothetical protein